MNVENISQTTEERLAAQIFDKYAEAATVGDVAQELGFRAIAAAKIMAYTQHREEWFTVLDTALELRGLPAHYSDLTPFTLRTLSRLASDSLTPITRRCRSVAQELEALNTYPNGTN